MAHGVGDRLAHQLAGLTHPTYMNYHPDVLKGNKLFGPNWLEAWGIYE